MHQCQFCQDRIADGMELILEDKVNEENTYFCRECANDMMTLLRSGRAEAIKTDHERPEKEHRLGIKGSNFCELDAKNRIVKVFGNFRIQKAQRHFIPHYQNISMGYNVNPNHPASMSSGVEFVVEAVSCDGDVFLP